MFIISKKSGENQNIAIYGLLEMLAYAKNAKMNERFMTVLFNGSPSIGR